MKPLSKIIKQGILAINWLIMSALAIFLLVPFFVDSDIEALLLAFTVLGLAYVFHKLINLIFNNASFQAALRNKSLAGAIYRQNKRLSKDELMKLSKLGLTPPLSKNAAQSYTLPKGERFSISSPDWYLINSLNYFSQKAILDKILIGELEQWSFVDQSSHIANYFINPNSLEKSKGNYITIKVAGAKEVTTESNLDNVYKTSLSAFKEIHPRIIDFKIDLIDRPKIDGLPQSQLSILTLPDSIEDSLCIQAEKFHYTILSVSNKSNRDFYRRTMFEIADSLTPC